MTHATVPALTHALPHTKQMNVYCHSCYYHRVDRHCSLCHFSPQSVYYQIYHATFYSDYYSGMCAVCGGVCARIASAFACVLAVRRLLRRLLRAYATANADCAVEGRER